jgi:hypothetical protein
MASMEFLEQVHQALLEQFRVAPALGREAAASNDHLDPQLVHAHAHEIQGLPDHGVELHLAGRGWVGREK